MNSSATAPSRRLILLAGLALMLAACKDDAATPYLEFAGGGFIFNYRTANHYYGFVVRQKKPIPDGARLRVDFEIPGGAVQTIEEPAISGRLQYKFQTGDLDGIEPSRAYRATLVLRSADGAELQRLEKSFRTEVDQAKLPDKPLVIGPGYQPNEQ